MELAGIRGCNNRASNIVRESLEEIDCVEANITESYEIDESFTRSFLDSNTLSTNVDPPIFK
ncbi:hypothetical protein CUMW_136440 [Citrus unshiu]|nr:hypothetical protein CUMW_136440 [Citrus unshiu]